MFISRAISKKVNVPKQATVEEIEQAYIDAWRLGAKAVSIYRDGRKPKTRARRVVRIVGDFRRASHRFAGFRDGTAPAWGSFVSGDAL